MGLFFYIFWPSLKSSLSPYIYNNNLTYTQLTSHLQLVPNIGELVTNKKVVNFSSEEHYVYTKIKFTMLLKK